MNDSRESHRRWWATSTGLLIGGTAYLLTLLDYGTKLTRTANSLGYASNFFDVQALAFLEGHIDVPAGSLGVEGFQLRGHEYMYFAPFPALLRIPVLMTTSEYDGRLTLLSMALAFVLMAVMTPKLVWLVRDLMTDGAPLGRFEAVLWAVFIALATGGTVLTFNASLPWVYHEVYAWAVPLVIGSMYWMLRVLRQPDRHAVLWLGAFALATILTRTTGGWAVCLTSIGMGLWLVRGRLHPDSRRLGWGVVSVGAVSLAIGIAYNMVKFRHPYLFPLEDQVWTDLNARRREALEVNGGTITGPQFLETSFINYFRLDGIRFVDYFPWITLPPEPARAYGGAFIDQSYRTGSVTSFMPLLLLLSLVSVPVLFRRGVGTSYRLLRVPLVAGVLVTGGVMGYGYLAYRYTCEFVPALVIGGAVGMAATTQWLVRRRRLVKALALAVLATGTAFSIAANMLTGFSTAAVTAGGQKLVRYLDLQQRLGGSGPPVTQSDAPPSGGRTDDLYIQGDCDRLYVNTGDAYHTWQVAERRSVVVVATLGERFEPLMTTLMTIETAGGEPQDRDTVYLQTDDEHRARVVISNETGLYPGQWFDVTPPGIVRIGVRDRPELGYAEVGSTPGGFVGYVRSFDWSSDWVGLDREVTVRLADADWLRARGVTLREEPGIDPPFCLRLAARAGSGS